ncbi:hypothetical protein NEUTE1DRAFT_109936 [Neurospora tetrasperma FGSC 2508]|uniref:Uncharacterized protein n=1 Tax=Neurospora tetrasperma (strain FGSC 2508 / ATCC MYA-4615 / P0657) TaxID=510951 RepID=F8MM65_NEUT8|nr:uncharacterized protein NEUTE1DRAFT_109936 [Neurospora tetrasperma FGSC 2508]EGO57739.1 hypothetical protein NEUTE1DRAFT_109936 [Neurospora tetrasperma FGSC 2508]EGZ71989.1 hypothetical protein NEUTE2DRAFT_64976 [Neurospora tetrasperma FGSC 2509]
MKQNRTTKFGFLVQNIVTSRLEVRMQCHMGSADVSVALPRSTSHVKPKGIRLRQAGIFLFMVAFRDIGEILPIVKPCGPMSTVDVGMCCLDKEDHGMVPATPGNQPYRPIHMAMCMRAKEVVAFMYQGTALSGRS